ncbi:MAG: YbbC/YhhH family protein [Proteobacteria bacterium]|nr:YbbC/YhhH family protein [Pseudomonadota bacterium]
MKRSLLGILLFWWATSLLAQTSPHSFVPRDGFVPTADVAIRIAVAVWEPIYGEQNIARQKPFNATLTNGVWLVQGSLPQGWAGGTALAEISQKDGRILRVSHGK